MKKVILGIVLLILAVAGYLFLTNFSLVKRLVGYNVPTSTGLPVTNPDVNNKSKGLEFLNVPEGFKISIAVKDLSDPRVIVFDAKGRMLVSETKEGRVSVLEDKDNNGDFETKRTLIDGLKSPHGLAFYTDDNKVNYLYIAETQQVARYGYDVNTGKITGPDGKNIATLPADGEHFTRTIAFGANTRKIDSAGKKLMEGFYSKDKLYISVGSSCNVCVENTWKRAAILESDPDGTVTAEFAGGLRNSVFFTFHPETGEMWATEMGRDNLGDNLPPDEINIIRPAGPEQKIGARRFGWPFCYGNQVVDKTFKPEKVDRTDIPKDCSQTEPATIEIPAHSAPLGLAFITSSKWPSQWKNNLLVAYHGSWNSSAPVGYKIVKFKVDKNGKVSEISDFITGWLSQDKKNVYGRPVDLKFGSDGALYVSDDAGGVIYRIIPAR